MPDMLYPVAVAGGVALFCGLIYAVVGLVSFAWEKLRPRKPQGLSVWAAENVVDVGGPWITRRQFCEALNANARHLGYKPPFPEYESPDDAGSA